MFTVILFYKYVAIDDPEVLKKEQMELCRSLNLTGRGIIAQEGINSTFEGKTEDIEKYIHHMQKDPRFNDVHFKKSEGTGHAFPKLSIKVRDEIVSLHLGERDIDPHCVTGKYITPEKLHDWFIQKKEFYIIDMRNAYEHKSGHFEGSILPDLHNFRDLPKELPKLSHLKSKTILTVCTGGVRCEKASGFLVENGFCDVYQLKGGIVSYMEKYPNEHFKGKLYVFDQRLVMGFHTYDPQHEIVGRCEACGGPSEHYINCKNTDCHRHFICCENCCDKNGQATCPEKCTISKSGNLVTSY